MEFEYIGLLLLCGAAMWAFIVACDKLGSAK